MTKTIRLAKHTTKIGSGQTPSGGYRAYSLSGIPLIRSQNVLMGSFNENGLVFISEEIDESMSVSRVQSGDVLLNITGASIGRVCVVPDHVCPANVNQHVCIIRCDETLAPSYVATLLASPAFQSLIWNKQAGGTRQALTKDMVENFAIPLIPRDQQIRISTGLTARLNEVETARQAARTQLRDAAALRTKSLGYLFSAIKDLAPIGSAAKLQSGYAFKSDSFKLTGVRLLRNTNILPGEVYWDDTAFLDEGESAKYLSYALAAGDVLISLDRPIISGGIKVARVNHTDLPALLVQRVGRFLIDQKKLDPEYLYAYLQTDMFISKIAGHDQSLGVPHISPSQVEAIQMPLPEIAVQNNIARKIADIDEACQDVFSAIRKQLDDLSRLPNAILAQAFEM